MRTRALLIPFALTFALSAPASAGDDASWSSIFADFFLGPQAKEEFRWSARVPRGQTLEIKGVNGGIHAEPGSGDEVEVVAVKRGRRSAPADVKVEVVEHEGGVTLCAVYPSPDPCRPNECRPGPKGRMNTRNNDVVVEFTVRVPAGVRFVGSTVNGGVEATRLRDDVQARTVNGSVRISTDGHARAETVNGSITAALGRADWTDTASFTTVNGAIDVTLPGTASTALKAATVNGSIGTDFSLSGASSSRRKLTGTIGSGGRELALETVNGSIHVGRRP